MTTNNRLELKLVRYPQKKALRRSSAGSENTDCVALTVAEADAKKPKAERVFVKIDNFKEHDGCDGMCTFDGILLKRNGDRLEPYGKIKTAVFFRKKAGKFDSFVPASIS